MGFKQGITDFPHRAEATVTFGNDVGRFEGFGLGVGDGYGASDSFQYGHIVDVVPDVGCFIHFYAKLLAQVFQNGALVMDARKDMFYSQSGGPFRHRAGNTGRYNGDLDAGFHGPLDADAVLDVVFPLDAPIVGVIQAAIGQNPVHIKGQQPNL